MAGAATTPTTKGGSALSLGLAVGILIVAGIALSRCGGAEEVMSGDQVTAEGGARAVDQVGEGGTATGPAPRQHESSAVLTLEVPAQGTTRATIESRPNWTMCILDMEGINRQFLNRQRDWVTERPSDGIRAWSYQSETAEPRTYRYRWDTDPNCSTPVPS